MTVGIETLELQRRTELNLRGEVQRLRWSLHRIQEEAVTDFGGNVCLDGEYLTEWITKVLSIDRR